MENISLTEGKEGRFPVGLWLTLQHTGSSIFTRKWMIKLRLSETWLYKEQCPQHEPDL